MSTVRNASVASPPSGPIEIADGIRAAIDTLSIQYDRNGKRGWQPAEARGLEKELHALAAAAGAAAEEMEKEAARKNMALVAQAAEKVAKEEPLKLMKKGDEVDVFTAGRPEARTLQGTTSCGASSAAPPSIARCKSTRSTALAP